MKRYTQKQRKFVHWQIKDSIEAGHTVAQTAMKLNQEGIRSPSGKPWTQGMVSGQMHQNSYKKLRRPTQPRSQTTLLHTQKPDVNKWVGPTLNDKPVVVPKEWHQETPSDLHTVADVKRAMANTVPQNIWEDRWAQIWVAAVTLTLIVLAVKTFWWQ